MYVRKLPIYLLITVLLLISHFGIAQVADSIYKSNIKTVRLYNYGNQLSLPIINLNTNELVELHFDDLQGDVKNYYYSLQLCNRDWKPENLSQFDYLKGFTQIRISNYRFSSIAFTNITFHQLANSFVMIKNRFFAFNTFFCH